MNALRKHEFENSGFFSFLTKSLATDQLEVWPLAGDASARRYFRVIKDQTSYVLMVWEPFVDDENYAFLSVLNHFKKHNILVPEVISKSPSEGLVLLEDLGDLTLERKFWENQTSVQALPFYKMAIDELIKIHYRASRDNSHCTAFNVQFDTEKLLWELNYAKTHLLEGVCNLNLSGSIGTELHKHFSHICETLHKEPKYIAHRDYHSRNVMLKLGRARVIDFQDARMGPIQYDLVSLIRDSYVDIDDKMASELINYYLHQRAETGEPPISVGHFYRIYELQTIQRCFKACGSFSSFYMTREDRRYLKYIPKTLQTVKKSLELFPEYKGFLNLLKDSGVFEKDYGSL